MIPQPKMVRILADIHTVEALIEQHVSYPDTALMVFNKEQADILEKHGVKQEEFKATYDYYLNHIVEMDKLYEIVVDTLSVRESKEQAAQGIQPQEQEPAPSGPVPATIN
ncbi:DUF4296 domain-containing protein [Pontibacter pamirensis]|uniref:DUF4296 domain-containing protein n=1 Tax=Pontibacter pamirensis TaxID=2562824 RepID=UPI00138A503E|nr:DUF4296 domain-containing protein [Pontibacter pamirensis]